MTNYHFAILKNEDRDSHKNWKAACENYGVTYDIIDLTSNTWLDEIKKHHYLCYLACPPGRETILKTLYDERIYIIENELHGFVYPSYKEIKIHENKKFLSYWLKALDIPHPKTFVFYNKIEALEYIDNANFPIVSKMSIGASGKGVCVHKTKDEVIKYVKRAFNSGTRQKWGPNLKMGGYRSRVIKIITNPTRIINKVKIYRKQFIEVQKGFVIFQEYIKHDYEWRIIKIGESFFGHQKIKIGDKASGTKGIAYIPPPEKLLDFTRNLCEKYFFSSMAVDLFEGNNNEYIVNELQCIFGHVQQYVCEKDGKPGRFKYVDEKWIFEEGMFNANLSYDLRLENAINIIESSK